MGVAYHKANNDFVSIRDKISLNISIFSQQKQ